MYRIAIIFLEVMMLLLLFICIPGSAGGFLMDQISFPEIIIRELIFFLLLIVCGHEIERLQKKQTKRNKQRKFKMYKIY